MSAALLDVNVLIALVDLRPVQHELAHPRQRFWPDGKSLLAGTGVVHDRLLDSAQLTATYLLALACTTKARWSAWIAACEERGCGVA